MLAGGVIVLLAGALGRHRQDGAAALAAHGGCIAGMSAGLPLCLLALPLPLVLGVETLLTATFAWMLFALLQRPWQVRSRAYFDPPSDIRESRT